MAEDTAKGKAMSNGEAMSYAFGDNKVTQEELTAALGRMSIANYFYSDAETVARCIMTDIRSHREPKYLDSIAYVDDYGQYWRYVANGNRWQQFGSQYYSAFAIPKRPLKRLVVNS